ncbi:hypothetical protein C8J56DRAFT_727546, partial [Mycena floridula]
QVEIGEVRFYLLLKIGDHRSAVAVVSLYSRPDPVLLQQSSQMYWTMQHLQDAKIVVVNVTQIQSCVAVIPDMQYGKQHQDGTEKDRWYLGERPGLTLTGMIG